MRYIVRLVAVLVASVFLLVADTYCATVDENTPQGANLVISASFKQSVETKNKIIDRLSHISDERNIKLAKVVPNPENFLKDRSLYYFTNKDIQTGPINWYRPDYSGSQEVAADLGNASLEGVYVAHISSPDDIDILSKELTSLGAVFSYKKAGWFEVLVQTVWANGYGLALVSVCLLLGIASLAYSASRARVHILQTLAGLPHWRILAAQLGNILLCFCVPALGTFLVALLAVFLLRGFHALGSFIWVALLAFVAMVLITGLCVFLTSILTAPRLENVAGREDGIQNYRFASEGAKYLAIFITAVSLPALVGQGFTQLGIAQQASYWDALSQAQSLRLGGNDEQLTQAEGDLLRVVTDAEDENKLYFTYGVNPGEFLGDNLEPFDGVMLTNDSYLKKLEDRYHRKYVDIDKKEIPIALRESILEQLKLWIPSSQAQDRVRFLVAAEQGSLPAISGTGNSQLELYETPLVVSVSSLSDTYSPSFITSVISTNNIFFDDSFELTKKVQESELSGVILSVDRASDAGLQSSQMAEARTRSLLLSLVLNMTSLVLSTVLASYIYLLRKAKTHYTQRVSGNSWLAILRKRLLGEAIIATALGVLAWISVIGQAGSYNFACFGVVLLCVTLSLILQPSFAQFIFSKTVLRKVS
ncbi:hypothetical protein [Rothia sp. P5764]|uniref:hypothetical protein n=1 Tax=unclassified Rothia (in: high G+C Gram-positive bacteria) TaxID=2689056 RepID=UPI003AD4E588